MGQPVKRQFGRILLDGGFLSQHDLEYALKEQSHTKELLGQVLVRMGLLRAEDIKVPLIAQEYLADRDKAAQLAAGERQLLGALLVQSGHISNEQLDDVLAEQLRSGEKLGEVFKRLGLLTQSQLSALLDFQLHQGVAHASPLRLGDLLVATGHITRPQLEDALRRQNLTSKKLGEVLVEAGYVRPSRIRYGLHLQKMLLNSVLAAILSLGMGTTSDASTVLLQWDPNTETNLAGYKVHMSADPATFVGATTFDVQKQTTLTIDQLDPDKAYNFAVTAYTDNGQESSFSNIVTIAEQSSPTVAITSPANATSISGTVPICVTAEDNIAVSKVEYYINGQLLATETTAPYTYSWDTTTLTPGVYTVTVKAYDAADNVGQASSSVTLVNDSIPPTVVLTAPLNNAIVNGTVTINATAADNVEVSKLELYCNNNLVFAGNINPYSFNWNTTTLTDGSYVLQAKAYDAAGNISQSSSITVTVANMVPDVTVPTLQKAYYIASAGSGVVHLAASETVLANTDPESEFIANSGKNVLISGGYDASNQTRSGVTVVSGIMKVRSGKVIAEGIALRNPKAAQL